jgi:hypothetical protein
MMRRFSSVLTAVACFAFAVSLSAQNWPAFRGTNAAGVADGTPTAV